MLFFLTLSIVAITWAENQNMGLLIGSGWCEHVIPELWAPNGFQCRLPNFSSTRPRPQILDVLQDKVFACSAKSCDILTDKGWEKARDLLYERYFYTTVVTNEGTV